MEKTPNRWLVAAICTLLMVNLGTVYAWSFFQKLLVEGCGWNNSQVAWAFSLAICFLGLAAAAGGLLLPKTGPRLLALAGSALFGSGYLLAAWALSRHSLPLLYLGYGLVGGTGLGLGYVTPVATVAKWFPDRKGLATGLVVMGFGFGALLMSKVIAPLLLELLAGDLVRVFAVMGLLFLLLTVPAAAGVRNPPDGWLQPGPAAAATAAGNDLNAFAAIRSGRFLLLWLIFFCNIAAGIAIIGFQSPLFQEVLARAKPAMGKAALAAAGASLIAVSSICNGIGRFLWGGLSDRIGRRATFALILATQVAAFLLLIFTETPWLFALLVCYVLLCYGGGFGTMPSFVLDLFGAQRMPAVYGAILTAWSAAGIAGPQLVALVKDRYPPALYPGKAPLISFSFGCGLLLAGLLLILLLATDKSKSN